MTRLCFPLLLRALLPAEHCESKDDHNQARHRFRDEVPSDIAFAVFRIGIGLEPGPLHEVWNFVGVIRKVDLVEDIIQLVGHPFVVVACAAGVADVVELIVLGQHRVVIFVPVQELRFAGNEGAGPFRFMLEILIRDLGEDVAGADLSCAIPYDRVGYAREIVGEVRADGGAVAAVRVLLREGIGGDVNKVRIGFVVPGRISVVVDAAGEALEEIVVDRDAVRPDKAVVGAGWPLPRWRYRAEGPALA